MCFRNVWWFLEDLKTLEAKLRELAEDTSMVCPSNQTFEEKQEKLKEWQKKSMESEKLMLRVYHQLLGVIDKDGTICDEGFEEDICSINWDAFNHSVNVSMTIQDYFCHSKRCQQRLRWGAFKFLIEEEDPVGMDCLKCNECFDEYGMPKDGYPNLK